MRNKNKEGGSSISRVCVCVCACMHIHTNCGQITWGLGKYFEFEFKCNGSF